MARKNPPHPSWQMLLTISIFFFSNIYIMDTNLPNGHFGHIGFNKVWAAFETFEIWALLDELQVRSRSVYVACRLHNQLAPPMHGWANWFFFGFWHITSLAITDQKLLFYPYIFAKNKAPEVKRGLKTLHACTLGHLDQRVDKCPIYMRIIWCILDSSISFCVREIEISNFWFLFYVRLLLDFRAISQHETRLHCTIG